MAEELAFARKASGLVRGLSMWDAFGVGFMNQGLTPCIWWMITLGLGTYLGGNLIVACVFSLVLAGIGFPLVWGILSGSMPRSGGEYIYNSRILHPVVGLIESFGNAVIWVVWIFVLAPQASSPGLTTMTGLLGWDSLSASLEGKWGMFVVATVINVAAFGLSIFGMRWFARVQRVVMTVGIGGCSILLLALSLVSRQRWEDNWNALAAKYDSLPYDQFVGAVQQAAGTVIPTTWNYVDSLGLMVAGASLFAYAYCLVYVAGEVKRPDRSLIIANFLSILVPCAFMVWAALALYGRMDFNFLSATAWADLNGAPEGYTLPFSPSFMSLAYVAWSSPVVAVAAGLSYVAFSFWWVVLSYLAFARILFAWGMDRMGPKWFTSVNPRWASPVTNYALCFVIAEVGLTIYSFAFTEVMSGLIVVGMEVFTVFGITAMAAMLFPYRKRARGIWESSPYKGWKLAGVPLVTIGAIVMFVYLFIIFWFNFVRPEMRGFTWPGLVMYAAAWTAGALWYFFWRRRSKQVGVDVAMTYGELPPE